MKLYITIGCMLILGTLSGCVSGLNPIQFGKGKEVEPRELAKHQSGSLSTIWYHGSDTDFHYFRHFIKASTRYKIRKEKLDWPGEYSVTEKKSEFAGDKIWEAIKKTENKSVESNRGNRAP